MSKDDYIPIDKCKDGYLYIIKARNADLGVYVKKEKGFHISRFKFKCNYIFMEYHWDTGEPFGTVKPIKELRDLSNVPYERLLKRLNDYMKILLYEIKAVKGTIITPASSINPNRKKQLIVLYGKK